MGQFVHNGVLYEEMPNGQARVLGPAPAGPQAPQPSAAPAPLTIGTPRPQEPKPHYNPLPKNDPRFRSDYPSALINDQTGEINFGPQQKTETANPQQTASQALGADHAIGQINIARDQIKKGWDTGNLFGSQTFQGLPFVGQNSTNLHATLQGLQGAVINDTIQQLKQLSSTGASGYGSLSETEAERLAGAVAALNQSQDADSLNRNLNELEKHYRSARALLAGEDPRDPNVQHKYGIDAVGAAPGAPGGAPPQDGGNQPPNGGPRKLNPDQQQQFFHILESQGPDAGNAYLQQFGLALKDPKAAAGSHSRVIDYAGDLGHKFAVGLGGVAQGVGDLANIASTPFVAGVNKVFGTNYQTDMGGALRDTLGLPSPQTEDEKTAFAIDRAGTSALGAAGIARAAAPYVAPVSNAIGNALARFGDAPLTDSAAGATSGAASDVTRRAGGGPVAQTAAGIIGGAAAIPAAGTVNSLMQPRTVSALAKAGQSEGVNVTRAMNDPSLTQKVTAVGKTMAGGRMMQRDMGKVSDQIQGRVQALGQGGEVMKEPFTQGQTVQNIGKRFIQTSGKDFERKYGKLKQASQDVTIQATEALGQVNDILDRLKQTPNTHAKEITYLEGLKSDLSNGLSVESSRDIGSKISKDLSKGDLTFGKAEKDVLGVRKAVSRDIVTSLRAAGKGDIATAFKNVDDSYSERMDFIHNTLKTLMGSRNNPLDAEKAASRFASFADKRGNSVGLARVMAQATPQERADIAATFADKLGKGGDGNFSAANLVKGIEGMPEAAQKAIFGEDGAKSLENLSRLAKEARRVNNALGGSPTGVANDYRSFLTNLILGAAAGGWSGSAVKGIAAATTLQGVKTARDAISAKLLMSPKLTGWLRAAPKTNNPEAINAHFDRLAAIAVREPALAPEIQNLRDAIMKAANENVTPNLAAEQSNQNN